MISTASLAPSVSMLALCPSHGPEGEKPFEASKLHFLLMGRIVLGVLDDASAYVAIEKCEEKGGAAFPGMIGCSC